MRTRVLVIGGGAAGMAAAGRAKRLDPDLDITILDAGPYISYGICGLPYFVSGRITDHRQLVHFTPETLEEERGIRARVNTRVVDVLPGRRVAICCDEDERHFEAPYDKLVIATGYRPRPIPLKGSGLEGVFTISRLPDGIRLREYLARRDCRTAAVVGGGYIGLMMASALREAGLEVRLFERERQVRASLDEDMAELVVAEAERNGVRVQLQSDIREIAGSEGRVRALRCGRDTVGAELVLIDVGILPDTELADRIGIVRGRSGAIQTDPRGQTDTYGIYAAGNCAETVHLVSNQPIFSGLATSAARQGRVVGENLAGRPSVFRGTLETSIEKCFDLGVSRTGLTLRQALEAGFQADSVRIKTRDSAGYLQGSSEIHVKLVFEQRTGRLLGGQMVGGGTAARRIDTLATALSGGLKLDDLSQLDLSYSPAFGTLWDPFQVAANVGLRKLRP